MKNAAIDRDARVAPVLSPADVEALARILAEALIQQLQRDTGLMGDSMGASPTGRVHKGTNPRRGAAA